MTAQMPAEGLGCSVGIYSTPHALHPVYAPRGQLETSSTLAIGAASQELGYAFAPLHFYDYGTDVPSHPGNLWTLDDGIPEDLIIKPGVPLRCVWTGYFNPNAAIRVPVRQFVRTAAWAITQLAQWQHHLIQIVVPLSGPMPEAHIVASVLNQMQTDRLWYDQHHAGATQTLDVHCSVPCGPEDADLSALPGHLGNHLMGAEVLEAVTEPKGATRARLFDIDRVTEVDQSLTMRVSIPEWNMAAAGYLATQITASAMQQGWRTRAVTITMRPENEKQVQLPATERYFDRLEDVGHG